jgi:hypothetical protein
MAPRGPNEKLNKIAHAASLYTCHLFLHAKTRTHAREGRLLRTGGRTTTTDWTGGRLAEAAARCVEPAEWSGRAEALRRRPDATRPDAKGEKRRRSGEHCTAISLALSFVRSFASSALEPLFSPLSSACLACVLFASPSCARSSLPSLSLASRLSVRQARPSSWLPVST